MAKLHNKHYVQTVLASVGLIMLACTAYGASPSTHKTSTNTINKTDKEEAASAKRGVDLIEHILQKMRNSPQLAMSSSRQSFAYREQTRNAVMAMADGLNLLIKPQAQRAFARLATPLQSPASQLQSVAASVTPAAPSTTTASTSTVAMELPGRVSPHLWEKSSGQFIGGPSGNAGVLGGGAGAPTSVTAASSFSQNTNGWGVPLGAPVDSAGKVISDRPLITEFGGRSDQGGGIALDQAKDALASVPQNVDMRNLRRNKQSRKFQSEAPALAGAANGSISPSVELQQTPTSQLAKKKLALKVGAGHINLALRHSQLDDKESCVAWSPPTIISGIPAVRLGAPEKELTRSLATHGPLHKDVVGDWSVWSLYKAKDHPCALQIFLKQGIVEAIRVYDQSLLSPDIGISLGDELSNVKQKFGEPAFILAEFSSNLTQNYIYPISQIDFQLGRAPHAQVPKIVSILIFNVH